MLFQYIVTQIGGDFYFLYPALRADDSEIIRDIKLQGNCRT